MGELTATRRFRFEAIVRIVGIVVFTGFALIGALVTVIAIGGALTDASERSHGQELGRSKGAAFCVDQARRFTAITGPQGQDAFLRGCLEEAGDLEAVCREVPREPVPDPWCHPIRGFDWCESLLYTMRDACGTSARP
jgi:hypothetical protein